MEPVEPVQMMNIYQSNTYRKDLSWLHFDIEPRVQEKQQVKDQQVFFLLNCVHIQLRQKKLNKQLNIQHTQHLSKSPVYSKCAA